MRLYEVTLLCHKEEKNEKEADRSKTQIKSHDRYICYQPAEIRAAGSKAFGARDWLRINHNFQELGRDGVKILGSD